MNESAHVIIHDRTATLAPDSPAPNRRTLLGESRHLVKVIHGANEDMLPVAGSQVSSVRASLVDVFNIPVDAIAFVNGEQVPNCYRLLGDDTLEWCGQRGLKAGRAKKNLTEEDLLRLGLAVVGDEAVPVKVGTPDLSWTQAELEAYAKAKLASSRIAGEEAILQSHKSAVDLFWAGCAFYFLRDKKKAEGRGVWTRWKREQKQADSTVHEAIKLYENAKTPDALIGLGITEAKEKFVYPFKDKGDDEETTSATPKPKKRSAKTRAAGSRKSSGRPTSDPDDNNEEEESGDTDAGDESPVIEPPRTLTAELEEIAQRLNEIAQDEMGKVDWKHQDQDGFLNAAQAVSTAISNVFGRINRDLQDS